MEIYAYFKPPYKQLMSEHVYEALKTFSEKSKFVAYGNSIHPSFHKMLYISIIFHDFGKVPLNFSNLTAINNNQQISFSGHEIISGWFVYEILVEDSKIALDLGISKDEIEAQELSKIITLAVLLHHYPMSFRKRIKHFEKNNKNIKVSFNEIEAFLSSIRGFVYDFLDFSPKNFMNIISKTAKKEFTKNYITNKTKEIYDDLYKKIWLNGSPKYRNLFLILLQGLVASDYCSAFKRNDRNIFGFSDAIKRFVELYGGEC
ncbi:MAG: CRISPR-associated endonuclease Cas3'' [Fervidicoccaceae archaeon]